MTSGRRDEPLAVFPLTGTLLLPGTYLPLNIFEPRYLNMVQDALDGDQTIGMIQPEVAGPDNWGVVPPDGSEPNLYPVGCRGRIAQHKLQEDGRYLIVLEGVIRFRVIREIEPVRGYRRVEADVSPFLIDREPNSEGVDSASVLAVLEAYAEVKGLELDSDQLGTLSGGRLVSMLSMALPFAPAEKQALLEAHTPEDRMKLLTTLMRIDLESPTPSSTEPPTIN